MAKLSLIPKLVIRMSLSERSKFMINWILIFHDKIFVQMLSLLSRILKFIFKQVVISVLFGLCVCDWIWWAFLAVWSRCTVALYNVLVSTCDIWHHNILHFIYSIVPDSTFVLLGGLCPCSCPWLIEARPTRPLLDTSVYTNILNRRVFFVPFDPSIFKMTFWPGMSAKILLSFKHTSFIHFSYNERHLWVFTHLKKARETSPQRQNAISLVPHLFWRLLTSLVKNSF